MEYRKLGRTDIELSAIGLGTMTWGFQNTQADGFEQMDYALEQGINFFDTAEMYAIPPSADTYGTTENIIGNWFYGFIIDQNQEHEEALKYYLKVYDELGDIPILVKRIGVLNSMLGYYEEAGKFMAMNKLNDEDGEVDLALMEQLGDLAFNAEKYGEAIESYTKYLNYHKKYSVLISRSTSYFYNNQRDKAIEDAKRLADSYAKQSANSSKSILDASGFICTYSYLG